ncbi:MAG: protein kinase [Planctomycetota bacterium]|nr:protein kinase [Planctomycetota bacterium]
MDTARVEELVAHWEQLLLLGQFVPPEELCSDCPELLEEVQKRIDEIEPRPGEETAVSQIGGMATIIEPDDSQRTDAGALVLQQRYRKLRFHARGGLGEIYVADDGELQRDVVLKFIKPKYRDRRDCREQFQLEAEVTARLDHPGVVPVYGFGRTPDGRMCYAMRFIQGETLEARIAKVHNTDLTVARGELTSSLFSNSRSIEFRGLLNRLVTVCQTMAYAHNRGILHRDIKPENIMLGKYGDTLVVDWGLAMPIDRDESARASGEQTLMPTSGSSTSSGGSSGGPVGTPAYMPPEQAAGIPNLTPACDIFSLGATLYKLLVGQAPYVGDSARDTLTRARYGTFESPRAVNSDVPVELDAICLKAMSIDPGSRYITASEMADDIERWLADAPVLAREERLLERCGRWVRHHREWTMAIVLVMAVILSVVSVAAVSQGRLAGREHEARLIAQTAHADSLQLTAQFVARAVGKDLQSRWLILQKATSDPAFQRLIERAAANGSIPPEGDPEMQLWLSEHRSVYSEESGPAIATSWFVTMADGVQLGRAPRGPSIGKFFGYRDYFHGQGRDLDPKEIQEKPLPPIDRPYRSIVFKSKSNGEFMIALSTPVWGEVTGPDGTTSRKVLAMLAMSQSLGDFEVLNARMGDDRVVVLVDTGQNALGNRGTVLHDSRTSRPEWIESQHEALADHTRQVPSDILDELTELRALRKLQHEQSVGSKSLTSRGSVRDDFVDYATPGLAWTAAFEPIIFRRPRDMLESAEDGSFLEDTGWVVVVQEPAFE